MAFLNNQAYELVLKDKHNHLVGLIETDMAQIKEAESAAEKEVSFPMPDKGEPGWFEKSRNAVARTLEQGASRLDIRARLDRIIEITKGLFENLIELIVVFLLNTILLPMLFLWGVIRFGQIIVASGFMNIYKKGLLGT